MGYEDRPVADMRDLTDALPVRAWRFFAAALRPAEGWIALGACIALALLPAWTLETNNWVRLTETVTTLSWTGALAVLCVWWMTGWGRSTPLRRMRAAATIYAALVVLLLGGLVLSQLIMNWLPGGGTLYTALRTGDISPIASQMNEAIIRFGARLGVWWTGVQGGSVIPDERVFALLAGAAIWVVAALSASLVRATRRALPAMLPIVLLVGTIVFFGGEGRLYFLATLALVLLLHVALDNNRMAARWQRTGADYHPDILNERWLNAAALASLALLLAALAPVFSVRAISDFYSRLVAPLDERIETVRQQAFPNIETAPRYSVAGTTAGLPNSFLLGSGPELRSTRILELRTGDSPISYDAPPFAPYLNATAFTHYTGLGWEPDDEHTLVRLPADSRRPGVSDAGRRLLAQTVRVYVPSTTLFAAGDFVEASVDTWLRLDAQGELTTISGGAGSYSLLSFTPALTEEDLRTLPPWSAETTLPNGFAAYLALPESVTPRTHALAAELAAGLDTPYDQAFAIQEYLRTFPYSLDIAAPPEDVRDVADYFLFELQTGYCDYYATAFVVLARSLGLPTRFMTGYAPGGWMQDPRAWLVTAADSHAWPEVYFAGAGWIPFEPTAARAEIARVGSGALSLPTGAVTPAPPSPTAPAGVDWNWQMLFWLLPIAGLLWLAWRLIQRVRLAREDPWLALQAWGARAGHPPSIDETPLEYGATVAALARTAHGHDPAAVTHAADAAQALGMAISAARYAPAAESAVAAQEARTLWRTLRPLLLGLRPRAETTSRQET
jgi:transglutaminase-like putative cysteine protease